MILTNHITNGTKNAPPTQWENRMESDYLPGIARKHGAELCPLRKTWRDHLVLNNLDENVFLADGAHLNDAGQALMLSIVEQFFVRDWDGVAAVGKALEDEWVDIGADAWKDGVLTLPFKGNRVEVLAGDGPQPAAAVAINGKKPSEWVELHAHTRIGHGWAQPGFLRRVEIKAPHKPQAWTLAFTRWEQTGEGNRAAFAYTITGAEAGLLGASSDGVFTPEHNIGGGDFDSDIFKINAKDFFFAFNKPFAGAEYVFETRLMGTDVYDGSSPLLLSGLKPGEYTLTLTALDKNNPPKIKRMRVFNPKPN
jgi:hypothetical protein